MRLGGQESPSQARTKLGRALVSLLMFQASWVERSERPSRRSRGTKCTLMPMSGYGTEPVL